MNKRKKILVGVATDGKGGVDSYILSFVRVANKNNISCDVLTTKYSIEYASKLKLHNANLILIDNLHNKTSIYTKINELSANNNYFGAYWNISTCIMYPYVKASYDNNIKNIIVHSHAHYNSQTNIIKTSFFDIAHYYYRAKMNKLNVRYAACAKKCAQWIAGNKVNASNNWLFVPNPIDANACKYNKQTREKIRNEFSINNKFVIGCATAFMPYKNPLYIIDVFSEILKLNPNSYLLLAGTGPMESEVVSKAKRMLPNNKYKLLGHRKDVSQLLQSFDIFLLPSINEGLPLCILEAQAASLPCIMSTNITEESIVLKEKVKRVDIDDGALEWAKQTVDLYNKHKARSDIDAKIVSDAGFNLDSPEKVLPLLSF